MDIQHIDDGRKGMFFIKQDGKRVAEMTYVWTGQDRIIIDHTAVDDVLKGQGAGKQLVAKAVEFAREKGIRILPLCPFAKHVFETVPEYGDVL
jgi:predicted GNAT family acetyltransferase